MIRVSLQRGLDGTLAIYDVAGRRVKNMHVAGSGATPIEVRWQGRDQKGRRVPSVVYFIRVTVSGESVTRRVALVR